MTLIKYGAANNLVHPGEGFILFMPPQCGSQSMQSIQSHAALVREDHPIKKNEFQCGLPHSQLG